MFIRLRFSACNYCLGLSHRRTKPSMKPSAQLAFHQTVLGFETKQRMRASMNPYFKAPRERHPSNRRLILLVNHYSLNHRQKQEREHPWTHRPNSLQRETQPYFDLSSNHPAGSNTLQAPTPASNQYNPNTNTTPCLQLIVVIYSRADVLVWFSYLDVVGWLLLLLLLVVMFDWCCCFSESL